MTVEPQVPLNDDLSASAATQLLEIARRHYVEEESFSDLARNLGINRFKIARLAREARARGLVQISVQPPDNVDMPMSDRLRAAWPVLKEAIVVPVPGDDPDESPKRVLAGTAAQLIMERTTAEDILGLACGRLVNETAGIISRLPPCTIVQLTGVTSSGSVADSSIRTMQRVAALSHGRAFPIYAPMLLESPEVVRALAREPGIAAARGKFSKLTRALVTVGAWNEGESTMHAACTPEERRALHKAGVVAEFTGHLLNADGDVVGRDFTNRCLVVPLADLVGVPELVVVAGGAGRVPAILAALRGGLIKHLVTDSRTAAGLVAASSHPGS